MQTSNADAVHAAARRRAAAIIATLGVCYLILIGFVLEPRTFFSGDAGVKYLQARSLAESHWQRLSVANPGAGIDPGAQFSVLPSNQFERRTAHDPYYGSYSVLFTVPVSVCLWAFGLRGLYVVPLVATLVTLALTYQLAARTAPRLAWLAPLLAGAASPLVFYSVDLWEHSLSALGVTACVLLFLGASGSTTARRCLIAGLLLGVAIDLREELSGLIPVALLAVLWIEPGRRVAAMAAAAGGVLLAVIPHWLLRVMLTGVPVRKIMLRAVTGGGQVPDVGTPVPWSVQVAFIVPVSWVVVLAMAAVLRGAASRVRVPWRLAAFYGLAAIVAVLAVGDALDLLVTWGRPDGLLAAFPPILLLGLWPPPGAQSDRVRREAALLVMLSLGFALVVAIGAPLGSNIVPIGGSQFGPRFLLPTVPLLAAAVTYVVDRGDTWSASGIPRAAVAIVAAVVTLAGVAVQLQGVRDLRATKAGYGRLVRATEAIGAGQPVVTDVWWYPAVTASVIFQHPTVAVNVRDAGTVTELLASPGLSAGSALTFVTEAGGPSGEAADALAAAGWREVSRQRIPLWRELDVVGFQRGAPAPTASDS